MTEPARRIALVTGTSSGFGLLASVELARAGFHVHASMRDLARQERLLEAARAAGVASSIETIQLDVTDDASILAAIGRIGRIDVLVNNAGYGLIGFFEDTSMDELREQLETNFFGLVAVTKAVLPGMRERGAGRIINVSSINGRMAPPVTSAYAASKFAVEGLSEALRYEVLEHGVFVTLIEPGMFKTDISTRNRRQARRSSDPASPYHQQFQRLLALSEEMRSKLDADPNDVARAIVRAASVERPPLRMLVGKDARQGWLATRLVPPRLFEAAVMKYLKRVSKRG